MLAIVLVLVILYRFFGGGGIEISTGQGVATSPKTFSDNPTQVISLSMQREAGDRIEPLADPIQIPWRPEMTLLDATKDAGEQSNDWRSKWLTSGKMYRLIELGGRTDDEESSLYWQFDLNGEYGKRGAGQTVLQPGDSVLWRLAPYR